MCSLYAANSLFVGGFFDTPILIICAIFNYSSSLRARDLGSGSAVMLRVAWMSEAMLSTVKYLSLPRWRFCKADIYATFAAS
jgi:hypothetical protein